MATRLLDLSDIVEAVANEVGVPLADSATISKIKFDINMIYENEVVPFKRWYWLTGSTKSIHKARYGGGTVSVTPGSTTVTLSAAPAVGLGSFANHYFAVDGFDEVYEISAHTAGSTTVTLSSAFQGALGSAVGYSIWTDRVILPTDCREVIEVYHQRHKKNMEGRGFQDFRQIVNESPKAESFPIYFNVTDFFDPTPGDDETESDRYRIMRVHPSITDTPVTLNIDYIKEISPLVDDGDEPLMPVEDRIVLVYGALHRAWSRERNPEEAARNFTLFQQKLARMSGKIEEGFDRPKIAVDHRYINTKRGPRLRSLRGRLSEDFGGASSYSIPMYLEGTTINGATIIGNVTVNSGITIDGRDISVDGAALDAHIAATTDVHGVGVGSSVVGTATSQTLTNKTITTSGNSITATTDTVAQFNTGTGALESSSITTTELNWLNDVAGLTTVALNDNQASAADVLTMSASFTSLIIFYSIQRGASNVEAGTLILTNDGTNTDLVAYGGSVGSSGVTLSADISAGSVRLRYTSTSTGVAPSFKYKLHKWAA